MQRSGWRAPAAAAAATAALPRCRRSHAGGALRSPAGLAADSGPTPRPRPQALLNLKAILDVQGEPHTTSIRLRTTTAAASAAGRKAALRAAALPHSVLDAGAASASAQPRPPPPSVELPPATGQSSDAWRPYLMHSCLHSSVGERYAPCLQERWPDKLAVAEELVYPDFRIRLPSFLAPEHEKLWLQMWDQFTEDEHDRCVVDRGWGYYSHQHGQNLVFKDVTVPADVIGALGQWGFNG
jgi:hypothetical protein